MTAGRPGGPLSRLRPIGAWHVLVPVKDIVHAKSRLATSLGEHRPEIALAFALDTVRAALRCASVASVTVVTRDYRVASVLGVAGARILAEDAAPQPNVAPQLNAVIVAAAARGMDDATKLAVLLGDLPALMPAELEHALNLADHHDTAFVPDAGGTGTTLLTAKRRSLLQPRFGPGSASAHAATGAERLESRGLAGLRRDVDDLADLFEAARLGLGCQTRSLLRDLDVPGMPRVSLDDLAISLGGS